MKLRLSVRKGDGRVGAELELRDDLSRPKLFALAPQMVCLGYDYCVILRHGHAHSADPMLRVAPVYLSASTVVSLAMIVDIMVLTMWSVLDDHGPFDKDIKVCAWKVISWLA